MTKVLSVGGSIIVPEKPDVDFLSKFVAMCREWLDQDKSRRLILVAGGGAPARVYQNAYKDVAQAAGTALMQTLPTGSVLWQLALMLSL